MSRRRRVLDDVLVDLAIRTDVVLLVGRRKDITFKAYVVDGVVMIRVRSGSAGKYSATSTRK